MAHHQTQHGMEKGRSVQEGDEEGRGKDPRTFRMSFPAKVGLRPFPFEGCSVQVATRTAMWVQLWNQHVQDTVVILEEVNLPHPRLLLCDMLVLWLILL